LAKVETLVRAAEILNVYAGGGNVLLFKVRQGQGRLVVSEAPGQQRPMTEEDEAKILVCMAKDEGDST
jgi:hypothetical protein